MNTFREYLEESDYNEYVQALQKSILILESGNELNEGLLDTLSDKLKNGITFIKDLAKIIGANLIDMLKLFQDKIIFNFFSKISWNISNLIDIVKKGYNLWKQLHNIIAKYITDKKIVKWTNEKLSDLDKFLESHPLIKKAGTLVVVGFLIYQWTSMISFTGDIEFDFDQSTLFDAIKGNYSLADLFATDSGIKMLMFIAVNTLTGITFPWPGESWVLFALSIVYTATKQKYPQIANNIIKNIKKYKGIKA